MNRSIFGEICTDNTGMIVALDDFSQEVLPLAKKEDAVGRNIVCLLPDYSLDKFYIENQSYNVQLLPSRALLAFSNYIIKKKKVYIKILVCKIEMLNRFFQQMSLGELPYESMDFLHRAFSDQVHAKEAISKIEAEGVVGTSVEMQELFHLIEKIADTNATLLLIGETGVGKSMFAKIIHNNSNRKNEPFVEINCAAIHKNLIESELFGYEKGSFTGASNSGKVGKIELAHKGTLFLDEITEMPLDMQQKLLQVIQQHRINRVGGNEYKDVDFRLVVATNRDLEELVHQGAFRSDLYYRINVIPMRIPPIRNRENDIISLALHFARKNNEKYGMSKSFSKEAMQAFCSYSWPGNVRELENLVERMILTTSGDVIEKKELPLFLQDLDASAETKNLHLKDALAIHEKEIILEAYSKYKTSVKVGEALGISQTSAARKIRTYLGGQGKKD